MISKGLHLIIISMIVFGILNMIENIIHYNIGRSHDNSETFVFNIPSYSDLLKIIYVMIVFGIAQGIITEYIIKD